ncbi:MAG TPA: 50S ribosomal protein L25 [Ktedonobacteraceae bacterium]|nr:50S ribosomal protein L25 [Ktedonobacteraceae bacterium]
MAEKVEIVVTPREATGKAAKNLRKVGLLPANIYGHHENSQAIQIEVREFERILRLHAATGLINLRQSGDGAVQTALIRHVQHDPRSGKPIHIDFFRVSMNERLSVKVALHFVGEAPGVKNEGGVLLHLLDTIEVEGMASDLPEFIEVDISSLTEIDSILHAGDVKLPEGFTLNTDANEGVAKIAATRAEKAEEAEGAATAEAATENAGSAGANTEA